MLPEISAEELSAGLDAVAAAVLEETGVIAPPVDALGVARRLGFTIAVDDRQRGRARYVRLQRSRGRSPHPTILLRPEPRDERSHWATAHEIGEHVAFRVFDLLSIDPREASPNAREKVANALAGRILLPTTWFAADAAACAWDLLTLKARYTSASHELIARRMLELPAAAIISIFDHEQISFRRSNLPGRVPPLGAAENRCWRLVHEGNRPEEITAGTWTVRGWPIHEEGWKREILRTEVEAEGLSMTG